MPEAELDTLIQPGLVVGLAWTEVGGELLHIETNIMPGKGKLILTGQLGDVMKESAQAALTYCRSRSKQLGVSDGYFDEIDIHIHVPAGAIPKDGPSAGITMATALYSAIVGKSVKKGLAMTGEVTLRGRVLPIGGLKEKALAALRAGITRIIIPMENQKDLVEIPEELRKKITFYPSRIWTQLLSSRSAKIKNQHGRRKSGQQSSTGMQPDPFPRRQSGKALKRIAALLLLAAAEEASGAWPYAFAPSPVDRGTSS